MTLPVKGQPIPSPGLRVRSSLLEHPDFAGCGLGNLFRFRHRESLPHLPPLLGREQSRPHLDEARHHIKDCDPVPCPAAPHPKTLFIQVADDVGIGEVLHEQLHHQHQILDGIDLQPLAVVRDSQPVRNILTESALTRSFRLGYLAPPFDRYHLPSSRLALPDDLRTKRPGNHIANPFKIRHKKPRGLFIGLVVISNSPARGLPRSKSLKELLDRSIASGVRAMSSLGKPRKAAKIPKKPSLWVSSRPYGPVLLRTFAVKGLSRYLKPFLSAFANRCSLPDACGRSPTLPGRTPASGKARVSLERSPRSSAGPCDI